VTCSRSAATVSAPAQSVIASSACVVCFAHLAHGAAARQRVCLALLDTETGLLLNLANFGAAESAGRPVPAFNAANDTEGWDEESIAEPVSG
jgi:hypothetical protein